MKADKKGKRKKFNYIILVSEILLIVTLLGGIAIYIYSSLKSEGENMQTVAGEQEFGEKIEPESVQPKVLGEPIAAETASAEEKETDVDLPVNSEETFRQRVKYFEPQKEEEVVLAFAGDVLFDDEYSIMARMKQRTNGIFDTISPELLEEMTGADIFMLNNEFTYTSRGEPVFEKQFTFRANPEDAEHLLDMGVDIVSLANNHAYDYGEISLLDSMDTLTAMQMPYVGAGRNLEEASAPFYFETDGMKIGFLSATQIERQDNPDTKGATENTAGVFRSWNGTLLYEKTAEAAKECDFLVVYVHWGSENTTEPDWAQKEQAKMLAQSGADLIIGDHSHCLQGIEMIEGVPVFYSLGNFLFNSKTLDTCLVKATVKEGQLNSLQFVPALQSDCRTTLLTGAQKARVIEYMRTLSPGITMDEEGYIQLN